MLLLCSPTDSLISRLEFGWIGYRTLIIQTISDLVKISSGDGYQADIELLAEPGEGGAVPSGDHDPVLADPALNGLSEKLLGRHI
jgi:hypothetical protein